MNDEDIDNNSSDTEKAKMKGEQEENFAAMLDKSGMGERLQNLHIIIRWRKNLYWGGVNIWSGA